MAHFLCHCVVTDVLRFRYSFMLRRKKTGMFCGVDGMDASFGQPRNLSPVLFLFGYPSNR